MEDIWIFCEDRNTVNDDVFNGYTVVHICLALKYLIGKTDVYYII